MKRGKKKIACVLAMVATMSLVLPFGGCSSGGFGYKFVQDSHVYSIEPDGTKTCGLGIEVTIVPDTKLTRALGLYNSIPVSVTVPSYYKRQKVIAFHLGMYQPVCKIKIPYTVESISLWKNEGYMKIVVSQDNPYYEVIDGDLYKKTTHELVYDYLG